MREIQAADVIENENSAQDSNKESFTLTGVVNLTSSGFLSIVGNSSLTGSCSPGGNEISLAIAGAIPERVSPCPCSGGFFKCVAKFTSLPVSPTVEATGKLGGSDLEIFSTVNFLELSNTLIVESATDLIVMGSCAPSGSSNITLTGSSPAFSSTCDCENGKVLCSPETLGVVSENLQVTGQLAGATQVFNPSIEPVIELDLLAEFAKVGEAIAIEGTCFPDSTDSIDIYWSGQSVTPGSPLKCDCSSFEVSNCRDSDDNSVSSLSFVKTTELNAQIKVGELSDLATQEIFVASLKEIIFGRGSTQNWEDGRQGFCVKLSPTDLSCTNNFDRFENPQSYMGSGVEVESFSVIESSAFIFGSDGSVWSASNQTNKAVGRSGSYTDVREITFGAGINSPALFITGHQNTGCFLHSRGEMSCFRRRETPVLKGSGEINFIFTGRNQGCYVTKDSDLFCSALANNGTPFNNSEVKVASGVDSYVSGSFATVDMSLTFMRNGKVFAGTFNTQGSELVGFTHQGASKAAIVESSKAAFLDSEGRVVIVNAGVATIEPNAGTGNLDIEGRRNGRWYYLLKSDGRILRSTSSDNFSTTNTAFGGSLYNDFIMVKAYQADICGVRANLDIYCFGNRTSGTDSFTNPSYIGTYTP